MIIECKCKKYKFKIPDKEIQIPGRHVKCEICNEQWYHKLILTRSKDQNLDILENINPSKANINLKIKNNNNDFKFLLNTLIVLIIFLFIYLITINFKSEILKNFPNLKNFYESLELVSELIRFYIEFLKGLFSEKFINL